VHGTATPCEKDAGPYSNGHPSVHRGFLQGFPILHGFRSRPVGYFCGHLRVTWGGWVLAFGSHPPLPTHELAGPNIRSRQGMGQASQNCVRTA